MQSPAIKPLIMIAVPTVGQHDYRFTQSLLGGIMPSNHSMTLRFLQGMEVGRARNLLVQEAVNLGAKYIMFRDEDTIAPANILPGLLYHLENHPEWTFVGGLYATKSKPPEPLVYKEWGAGPFWNFNLGEMVKVLYTGMGASLIRIADIAHLPANEYPERNPWTNQPMMVRELFKTDDLPNEVLTGSVQKRGNTEDAFFFAKLEQAGLRSYVDTNMVCGHLDVNNQMMYFPAIDGKTPEAWHAEKRVINLGAGGDYDPRELQVDLLPMPNIDFVCDIRKLPDEWADSFDVAKASHVLEHFDGREVPNLLKEWFRIVKPGGRIEIQVPDLQAVAERLIGGDYDVLIEGRIYGDGGEPFWRQPPFGGYTEEGRYMPHSYDNNRHKTGFTAKHLIDLLRSAGFANVKAVRRTQNWVIDATGEKPCPEPGSPETDLAS